MNPGITESVVEAAALEWFGKKLGYAVLNGPNIAPDEPDAERASYADVVLAGRLRQALALLNPAIPATPSTRRSARSHAHRDAESRREQPPLPQAATDGVDVEYRRSDGSIAGDKVWLIDFATREERLAGREPVHRHREQAQPPRRCRGLRQRPAPWR